MNNNQRKRIATTLTCAILASSGNLAFGATITDWNLGNVDPDVGPDSDGTYVSVIYDRSLPDSGAQTNGQIAYTPPEGASPGLKVVNNAQPSDPPTPNDVNNCIMAAGSASCNSEFQSGKRFKLNRTAFDPIDLVFTVDPTSDTDAYKVFEKYGNATGQAIESFTVELGYGIGAEFVASTEGDGLGFVDFGSDPRNNQFSALFAAGLFGPTDPPRHPLPGYFDNDERAGFGLELLSEDQFQSTGLFGSYEHLFGDWMAFSMAPEGFFYDHDGDPSTDALLMAHYDEDSGKWIQNRDIDSNGDVVVLADANDGILHDDLDSLRANLTSDIPLLSCDDPGYVSGDPCLDGVDAIEDLAKFNLTYFLDAAGLNDSNSLLNTAYSDIPTFTLRITAIESVPEPAIWSLLSAGLLGMTLSRRRARIKTHFA
ncbi:MAG: choice-of-anchor F family protein [Methylohalobius crimeensis]